MTYRPYSFWTAEDDDLIFAGWQAGKSIPQIARTFPDDRPRTPDMVRMRVQTLRKHGIDLKERGRGDLLHLTRYASLSPAERQEVARQKAIAQAQRQERAQQRKEKQEARVREIAKAEAARIAAKEAFDREFNGCFPVKDLLIFTDNISPEEERDFGRIPFIGTHIDGCASASWGVK